MNTKISALLLSICAGVAAITVPMASQAATVGYHGRCSNNSTPVSQITAAGHVPVAVASLDAGSLAGLDALLIFECRYTANVAVNNAVANGLEVIIHDWSPDTTTGSKLPGSPAIVFAGAGDSDRMDLAAASPIATGPGGPLTNASLDGGTSSYHGAMSATSLPVGSTALTIAEGDPSRVVSFAYAHGTGYVVYGGMPLDHYLPGGTYDQLGLCASNSVCAGMQAYLTNLVAWSVDRFVSCAAEGFTGSKLTLCRQVCEIDQTPTRLTSLIKLYISAYRSEPPCGR